MTASYGAPHAIVGLAGLEAIIDGIVVSTERTVHLQVPKKFTPEHMERIRNDLAILADTASRRSDDLMAFQNAVLAQDPEAPRLARELGLTESQFAAQGGGIVLLIIAIAVAAALLLESDTPPTPAPAPDAGAGAPDAGPG